MCVAAHLRRGAARENLDHGRALAAMAEVFAGFRAGRVGARDGAAPALSPTARPFRAARPAAAGGGDGDVLPAAARPPWTAFRATARVPSAGRSPSAAECPQRALGPALPRPAAAAMGGAADPGLAALAAAVAAAVALAAATPPPPPRLPRACVLAIRARVARGEWEFFECAARCAAGDALAYASPAHLGGLGIGDLARGDTSVRGVLDRICRLRELGGDVLAEAAFGGDGSRAVDHTDVLGRVLARYDERPHDRDEVEGPGDGRLRVARGLAEVAREVRLARVALRTGAVARASRALDCDTGRCDAAYFHAESPRADARLLVCVRAALYVGPTGAAILDALHGPDGAREVARFAGGSVHDRLVDTGALADRLWVERRCRRGRGRPDAGAAVAVEIRADAPGATQLARDSALAPTLASLGRLRRRHPAAALELAYAALSLHFIQFCAAARGALAAMRLAGPVGSPGARALDAGAADRVLAEAWDGAAGLGLRTLPCAAHVAATLRACADARRRLARREWRAGAAAAAGLAAAAAELLAAPWRMQEYEHAYVELVADDAARLSAEFEHHRVLAGLRASCAAAAFSSGAGGAHDAAEDFAAPCLVEDPVAADFEYLWDSQDPGVAAWRARGGPGVPRGAPWPAVPFLEPGGASPWALDADAPSIVEDRAWRRQLVALRGALAAARAQRHRLPRDARAAYATAAACLALHCASPPRLARSRRPSLRLRDGASTTASRAPDAARAVPRGPPRRGGALAPPGRPAETRRPTPRTSARPSTSAAATAPARARSGARRRSSARVDVVRLGAALAVAPAGAAPRRLVAAAELALAWRTILARLDGPAAAAAPPLPRVGRVLAAVSHFEAAALYTHCLVEHGEVRAAVAYDAAVRTVVAKSRAPWRSRNFGPGARGRQSRDALERLRDALQDPGAASHVADERHNDFSRVDLAGLDDALHQARAVERKSPELDAAIASAMAVRDKRAELKRRFAARGG
ncbi:hypothetical protein JL721_7360 [Aureococcus anophagefferens]|nr:hypothetical protein JL721_7360 [Aureococcus anophagefferens]